MCTVIGWDGPSTSQTHDPIGLAVPQDMTAGHRPIIPLRMSYPPHESEVTEYLYYPLWPFCPPNYCKLYIQAPLKHFALVL